MLRCLGFLDGDIDKSDRVEGAIGEGSRCHASFGYYAQGVGLETAILPEGWESRTISVEWEDCGEARAVCPEVHDLVASKLVAGREKDIEFTEALLNAGIIDPAVLKDRIGRLPLLPGQIWRILTTASRLESRIPGDREES